ncbi:MAG: hypothetical protein A4S09_15750 [Proteobacteria bacterium SG_bin7]|nr:MAG: hypothetical protein A4S09_15750 [Proteobacteria bacterium SG_bin7]
MRHTSFHWPLIKVLIFSLCINDFCFASVRTFENTFKIERDSSGKIGKIILLKSSQNHFLLESDYMQHFLDELVRRQNEVQSQGASHFIETEMDLGDWPDNIKKDQYAVNRVLNKVPLEPILKKSNIKEALNILVVGSESDEFNFRVIAVPYDSRYFYASEAALKLFLKASSLVTFATGGSFGASAGLFLVQSAFNMLLERRIYFQNYFLYYLEKYGPEKYGMTKTEANLVKSSIYESRIKFWDIWEKNRARVDWENYGQKKFLDQAIASEERRKSDKDEFTIWGSRIGFAFHDGETSGYKRIVNLFNPRNILSEKASPGYEYNLPTGLRTKRLFYFLSQLAVRLSPVPVVSDIYDHFVESLYVPQRQTEGGLYGYFCDTGLAQEASVVVQQSINPFVVMEVGN